MEIVNAIQALGDSIAHGIVTGIVGGLLVSVVLVILNDYRRAKAEERSRTWKKL